MVNQDPINVASDFLFFFKKGNESSGIYQERHSLAFPLALLDLDVCLVYLKRKTKENGFPGFLESIICPVDQAR